MDKYDREMAEKRFVSEVKKAENSVDEGNYVTLSELHEFLDALDAGLDDMEAGNVTTHSETMGILYSRYKDYVETITGKGKR